MKKIKAILSLFLLLSAQSWGQLEVHPGTTVSLGTFFQEKPQSVSFELVNRGSTPVVITKAASGCPCFEVALYEKKIPPGGKVPLDIFIDARRISGSFVKKMNLYFTQDFSTNLTLFIEGESLPAIQNAPRIFSAGILPVGVSWSTNLTLSLREDLSELPRLKLFADPNLQASVVEGQKKGEMILRIWLRETTHPFYWKGEAHLFFPDHPSIPSTRIQLTGCVGGTLHFSSQKEHPENGRVRFLLKRVLPPSAKKDLFQRPLQSKEPGISIKETFLSQDTGCSQVELLLSNDFLERLQKEGRISLSFFAKGYIPATILLEN